MSKKKIATKNRANFYESFSTSGATIAKFFKRAFYVLEMINNNEFNTLFFQTHQL